MCGSDIFQIKNKSLPKKQFAEIKNKFKKIGKVIDMVYCINFNGKITLFNDGRALIKAKSEKEANRYIQRWDDEKISVENARWGPVIKFGKKIISIPKKADGARATAEDAAVLTLEQVKKIIEAELPEAFAKKSRPSAKKTRPKKTAKKNGR